MEILLQPQKVCNAMMSYEWENYMTPLFSCDKKMNILNIWAMAISNES